MTAQSAPGTAAGSGRAEASASAPVVAFGKVHKSYGSVRAVADLDLTLHQGETVALLGPNGAGKSSTLDLLLGLRTPTPAWSGSSAPPHARPSRAAGWARCSRAAG